MDEDEKFFAALHAKNKKWTSERLHKMTEDRKERFEVWSSQGLNPYVEERKL
jgi:hypothetical protein